MKKQHGYSLIEVLLGLLILVMIMTSTFVLIRLSFKFVGRSEARITASNLASEQMELIRNFTYNDLGTTEGWPTGNIPSTQTKNINGINYTIKTDIQYIDDPLDGQAPADLYNADYKKARVWVQWDKYSMPEPVLLVSTFTPKGLESPAGGGTLVFQVINNATQPVPSASAKVQNTNLNPNINISTQTDASGRLIVPALPQDTGNNYSIQVSKNGYTNDYTSAVTVEMPTPILPHQSIVEGGITSVTMTIDKVSHLKIKTTDASKTEHWCDEAYKMRKQLTIKNNSGDDAEQGRSIKLVLDHKSLVTANKSKDNGDDVRVFYWNGSACEELDRINYTAWNADSPTEIWYATASQILAGQENNSYYVYYNNPNAGAPPFDLKKIFEPSPASATEALYYFEDGSGTNLTDYSGNNNNGTTHENDWLAGQTAGGLKFKGGSPASYVSVPAPDGSSLDINGSLTLEAWIAPSTLSGKQSIIDRLYSYALWLDGAYVNFGVFDLVTGMKSVKSNATIAPNAWTHVAGVYSHSDGTLKIYINGSQDISASGKIDFFVTDNSYELRLGNGYIAGDFASPYLGIMDNARISSTALTSFPHGVPIDYTITQGEEIPLEGSVPVGNISITILGERILGLDQNNQGVLRNKFENQTTDGGGNLTLSNIEWDRYTFFENDPTRDLAEISPANPVNLSPDQTVEATITLKNHADNTLHVTVKDSAKTVIPGAQVKLTKNGFDETKTTSGAGQVFFTPLDVNGYTLEVSKSGYITSTETINITGNMEKEVMLSSS